jgi:hypothetical protein
MSHPWDFCKIMAATLRFLWCKKEKLRDCVILFAMQKLPVALAIGIHHNMADFCQHVKKVLSYD